MSADELVKHYKVAKKINDTIDAAVSDLPPTLTQLITEIHATPHLMTLDFAGAGAQSLAWLHSVGGSSRTVLEATDRYTPASLIEAVGFTPKRFTSLRVAKALADNAQRRAIELAPDERPVFGVGCSATIATDRKKRGEHRVVVAVTDSLGTLSYELVLTKGERSRFEEERLVSIMIVSAVAEACGVFALPELELLANERVNKIFEPVAELSGLLAGDFDFLTVLPNGSLSRDELRDITLLSGSFNPLHEGHRKLAEVAQTTTQETVYFELPLINADKDPIDLSEAHQRAVQFLGSAPLVLSRAPLFGHKAALFPSATFVVGADTAARLVALRFYDNDADKLAASLESVRTAGGRFLVAGRSSKGDFKTLEDIHISTPYRDLFTEIPEEAFNMDISSTQIRERLGQD